MVKHVLLNKLKETSKDKAQEMVDIFLSMKGKVPCVVDVVAACDFLKSARSYDVILEVTFNSPADLDEYQKDPYHCSVVKPFVHEHREACAVVDYEF